MANWKISGVFTFKNNAFKLTRDMLKPLKLKVGRCYLDGDKELSVMDVYKSAKMADM